MRDSSLIDNDAVFTTSATTNEFGVATVTISQQLDPQELELLVWNWDSYYLPDQITMEEYKELDGTTNERAWTLGFERSGTEIKTLTETEMGYTIQFEFAYDVGGHTTAYLVYILEKTDSDYDALNIDFVSYYTRSNNTVHVTGNKFFVDYWDSERQYNETNCSLYSSY